MANGAFHIVIPARFASERLPGKVLLDLAGQSMLERAWRRACASSAESVVIATDDQRIVEAANSFGARVTALPSAPPCWTGRTIA
jgi:3-deoxy-manno-octulosonate cytidylyltransferase (CMP-KDO synthetase)